MTSEAISAVYLLITLIINTNTAAFQLYCFIYFITHKY
jgi:hypothetical protein